MIFYNFLFIFILSLFLFSNKKNQKIFYVFIVCVFFILSFIRWEVGTDWTNYLKTFYVGNIKNMYLVSELGFKFLNYIVYKIYPSYTLMLFILASILFSFKYSALYKLSYCPILSLLMAYSLDKGDIFFVRQSIAIAITFYSTKYIIKKEKLKFIIYIILASLIHKSSLIFIFAYFIYNNLNLKRRHYFILVILTFLFSAYINEIIKIIIINMPVSVYKNKLLAYFFQPSNFGQYYKSYMSKNLIFLVSVANRIFMITVFFLFWKKVDNYLKKIFSLYFISFLGFICFYRFAPEFSRIILSYENFQLIIYPSLYKFIKNKYIKIVFISIGILYLYLKLLSGLTSYINIFIPYKSIFNI